MELFGSARNQMTSVLIIIGRGTPQIDIDLNTKCIAWEKILSMLDAVSRQVLRPSRTADGISRHGTL